MDVNKIAINSSYNRRKMQKSHLTIDFSDLEYSPQRKGSGDSLSSQRSLESQQSSDSHSSITVSFLYKINCLFDANTFYRSKSLPNQKHHL